MQLAGWSIGCAAATPTAARLATRDRVQAARIRRIDRSPFIPSRDPSRETGIERYERAAGGKSGETLDFPRRSAAYVSAMEIEEILAAARRLVDDGADAEA